MKLIAFLLFLILLVLVWPMLEREMCFHGNLNACVRAQAWGMK